MRTFIGLAVAIALLAFVSSADASVAVREKYDGTVPSTYVGEATELEIEGQDVTFDNSKVTILANGHKEDVTEMVSPAPDNENRETNLTAAWLAYGVIKIADIGPLDASDERWLSLANGTPGQMITIQLVAATAGTLYISDDGTIDANMTTTGWDDLAFNAALDCVTLLYVDDTYGWIIIGTNSVTVT